MTTTKNAKPLPKLGPKGLEHLKSEILADGNSMSIELASVTRRSDQKLFGNFSARIIHNGGGLFTAYVLNEDGSCRFGFRAVTAGSRPIFSMVGILLASSLADDSGHFDETVKDIVEICGDGKWAAGMEGGEAEIQLTSAMNEFQDREQSAGIPCEFMSSGPPIQALMFGGEPFEVPAEWPEPIDIL